MQTALVTRLHTFGDTVPLTSASLTDAFLWGREITIDHMPGEGRVSGRVAGLKALDLYPGTRPRRFAVTLACGLECEVRTLK